MIRWSPFTVHHCQKSTSSRYYRLTRLHVRAIDSIDRLDRFQGLIYSRSTVKISNFWKSKMAAAAILKITEIAISQQWFGRSSRNLLIWCKMGILTAPTVKNLNFKVQDGGQPPFWKPLNRHICTTVRPILMKFGTVMHGPPTWRKLIVLIFENLIWLTATMLKIEKNA